MQPADILILSNGPGEVTTWVRPVVKALRQELGDNRSIIRISVVLSPCPNATGREAEIAGSYSEVDRVQGAEYFWRFLLSGKTAQNWDWRDQGVVLFLGGDQFFTVIIGKRLGYRTVVYAEWDARWHSLVDRFGVMKPEIISKSPQKYEHKLTVVGDLMADVGAGLSVRSVTTDLLPELIALLPGSKPAKLSQGVPLTLAIADHIHAARPQTRFVIPIAPTLDLATLARFADPGQNPLIHKLGWSEAKLINPASNSINSNQLDLPINPDKNLDSPCPVFKTARGLYVQIWQDFPAHNLLSQCQICLTTVGANTAELGSLAVPMIVLLPTQQLDAMRSWDGLPGILARLPGVGSSFAKLINWLILHQGRLFAWPNIWAKAEIVPELVGKLQPQDVARLVLDYLEYPEKLEEMRSRLRAVRGEPGAAQKLAQLVGEELGSRITI